MNSYIRTATGMALMINNKPYNVDNSHPNYALIVQAVKDQRFDEVPELINVSIVLHKYSRGKVVVDVDAASISYNGVEVHNCLVNRIFTMMEEGFPIDPMVNFLANLMENPSKTAVNELYLFMERGNLPLTEDGCFIAYKRVNGDYMDCHSRSVLNKPNDMIGADDVAKLRFVNGQYTTKRGVTVDLSSGQTVISMMRNAVDDNRDNTCSEGLHFCSHEYLKSFGGERLVVLKINPADVVSIPSDYNNTKGRTCKYVVVGEVEGERRLQAERENIFTDSVYDFGGDYDYDDDDCDDSDDDSHMPQDYQTGYRIGYKDGRSHKSRAVNCDNQVINDGYDDGYYDGRKKNHPRF